MQLANTFLISALENIKLKQYSEAIKDFNDAIELEPQNASAVFGRGRCNWKLGIFAAAIADFDQAIILNPQYAEAFKNRAYCKRQIGLEVEAILDYSNAIELDPNSADNFCNRGAIKHQLNLFIQAVADYDRSIELDSKYADAFCNRGISKFRLGKLEAAISDFDHALTVNPYDYLAYHYRGNAKIALRKTGEAISDFCRAIPLSMGLQSSKKQYIKLNQALKFRQVTPYCLKTISEQQVWFAHPSTFNDVDDGRYLQGLFNNDISVNALAGSVLAYSCFGIEASSPEIQNDEQMWGYYADGSRGICLRYNYNPDLAKQAQLFMLDAIRYDKKPKLEENESLYDVIRHGFFTKSTSWTHEHEYRFIAMASDSAVRNAQNEVLGQSFNESDLGFTLCEIEFGSRCSESDKEAVKRAIRQRSDAEKIRFIG